MLHSRSIRQTASSVAVIAALALAACSSDSSYGSPASVTQAGSGTTGGSSPAATGPTISGFKFSIPAGVTAGTPFTVTNDDSAAHTFTNPDGAFDVSVPAGGTAEVTIAKAGTYTVVCKIHGSMKAEITAS
jgi:plastocyanin